MIIHVVRKGDTVYGIGKRYGVPAESIIQANQLADPAMLVIGQALAVPGDFFSYSVKKGDSMYSIARSFGISLETLLAVNPQIGNAARLQPGQTVISPFRNQSWEKSWSTAMCFPGSAKGSCRTFFPI